MPKNTLISIITPSYFSEKYIDDCIKSVLSQTYENWEMLIVDGNSKDATLQIIEKYSLLDDRIKIINNYNDKGPAQARAEGIKKAKGEYIAFIDSDDLWIPDKIQEQLNFMKKNKYHFSFTSYKKLSKDNKVSSAFINGHSSNDFRQYLRRRGIANSTVMLKAECFDKSILDTVGKSHGEDTLWWLLIMKKGYKSYLLDKPLTNYREVKDSLSKKVLKNQKTVWHSYRNELKLGIFDAAFNYFLYLIDVAIRRIRFYLKNNFI